MWAHDSSHVYLVVLGFHLLGATVWTGGHLVLAFGVLPGALRARDPSQLAAFERAFSPVGIPALLVQVATGLWLALLRAPEWTHWIAPTTAGERAVTLKLACLAATAALALSAQFLVLPTLDARRLPLMAAHVAGVTVLSVLFVILGLSFRVGGIG
jgi:putative copper export protein